MEELDERSNNREDSDNDDDDNTFYEGTGYILSGKALEKLQSNDPKLTSINLGEEFQVECLRHLLETKELCVKAGKFIGNNTHLKSLYIPVENCQDVMNEHSENFHKFLMAVANNRSLTVLDLGYLPDDSDAVNILAPLFKNNALTAISFENCNSTHIKLLASSLRRINNERGTLKHLRLEGTREGDAVDDLSTPKLIKTLIKYHCLETFTLNWTTINERSSRALSNMLRNDCILRELTLEANEFDDESFSIFANGLLENSTLKILNLKRSEYVSAEGWVNFFSILRPAKMGALHTICLDNNNINDEGVAIFAELFANSHTLKKLSLSQNNSITTVGWQTLASLLLNTKSAIHSINIINENNSFDDDAAIAWANALSISKNAKLKILEFIPLTISDRGWSALENLVCNKTSVNSLYDSNHIIQLQWLMKTDLYKLLPKGMRSYKSFERHCRFYTTFEGRPLHEVALHKIIQFYFKKGKANMKELLDMELNLMVHAISRIGSRSVSGCEFGGRTLLYQLIRSVPSLFDVSSNMKKRKVVE